jgi:uncharacterized protein (DUF2384 family)
MTASRAVDLGLDVGKVPDLGAAPTRRRLTPPAIKAFFKIAEAWELKNDEARALLGSLSSGKYFELKKHHKGALTQDELTRVSLLIGIFKSLNILFSRKLANQWVSRPNSNPLFNHAAPLALIRSGIPGMMSVRRLLDSRRGGR